MMNNLKIAKVVSKFLLILLLLLCLLLSGFTSSDNDELYDYQWGLKNSGNFLVDRGILADNHNVKYYEENFTKNVFKDSKGTVLDLKKNNYDPGYAYSSEGVDIWWESGYSFFSHVKERRDVIVAVIDSGVDINHPEIKDNIWVNVDEIPNNGIDDDQNGYVDDVNGYNFYDGNANVFVDKNIDIHGTHSAGIIAAKHNNGGIKGIAYDKHIKIMPIKILGTKGQGYVVSLVQAIRYAKANGADICNISLGAYTYVAALDDVIKNNPDMLFVVAAGNGAKYIGYSLDDKNVYPAKFEYPNVITVGNVCFDGERYVSSNYGSPVDLFAPGTFILSTVPDGEFGYLTGTSMAAPFVSATCAMIYCAFPNVPIAEYRNILVNSATLLQGLTGLCKSFGILNIYNALQLASTY